MQCPAPTATTTVANDNDGDDKWQRQTKTTGTVTTAATTAAMELTPTLPNAIADEHEHQPSTTRQPQPSLYSSVSCLVIHVWMPGRTDIDITFMKCFGLMALIVHGFPRMLHPSPPTPSRSWCLLWHMNILLLPGFACGSAIISWSSTPSKIQANSWDASEGGRPVFWGTRTIPSRDVSR